MTRSRTALAAGAVLVLLAGCGGPGDASQEDVRDRVADILVEDGFGGQEFSESDAQDAGSCVARAMFESEGFTPEERNQIASAGDGDPPSDELVASFSAVVDDCLGASPGTGPEAPGDDEADSG